MIRTLQKSHKLNVAYTSPLNPVRTGISDYSEALIPPLSELVSLTIYSDCGVPSSPLIGERFSVYPVSALYLHHCRHDLRLYQIGNSPHHQSAFDAFRRLPGIVTLHEPFLHHGFYGISWLRFCREAFYERGVPDHSYVDELARCLVTDHRDRLMPTSLLIRRFIDSGLGIIVHSKTAHQMIENYSLTSPVRSRALAPIAVIPQLMPLLKAGDAVECRSQFGLPQDALIFGMAGIIHPIKEPSLALQAFARLSVDFPQALFLFVGEILQETGDLLALARELGIADKVVILGRVEPLERLHQAIAACDVVLNLRRTTIGETSAIALRAMALGRPVVVRDSGWFGELPDGTCVKIGPEGGTEELTAVLRALATSPEMRLRLGQEARRYVQRECDPHQVARQYAEFLWDVYLSIVNPWS